MRTTGAILIVFGVFVLLKPELIAYIVAILCILIGAQFLMISGAFSKNDSEGPIKFGDYEIHKRRK